MLLGRPPIVINAIIIENLLVIEDGIYTLITMMCETIQQTFTGTLTVREPQNFFIGA